MSAPVECTGISATWCPRHGDCKCEERTDGEGRTLDDAGCPLHGRVSTHATEPLDEPTHELDPVNTTPSGSNACRCGQKWPCSLAGARLPELRGVVPADGVNPEWVMLGWRRSGKCWLMVSLTVHDASMRFVRQTHRFIDVNDLLTRGVHPVAEVNATVQNYRIVSGDTYAECLAAILFDPQRAWRPDNPPPAINGRFLT